MEVPQFHLGCRITKRTVAAAEGLEDVDNDECDVVVLVSAAGLPLAKLR
jgi:hypothetical protein